MTFGNSSFLVVHDGESSQSCPQVRQSPPSASVAPGGSVSLHCSLWDQHKSLLQCPPQHSVHWFRAGSLKPHTGFTVSVTNSSCVFLSTTIEDSSEAGTYYCAVDTCGRLLFGPGTKVETPAPSEPVVGVLTVLLCGCVLLLFIVVLLIVLCVRMKRASVCAHCSASSGSVAGPDFDAPENMGTSADLHYAGLNFSSRKMKLSSKTRGEECVYSSVREEQLR
uniref:Ig-like domain-containing protein n=1 Tax=Knipowitschia caucasica TaxID=637954 RepID=A0AAV2MHD7_KNICA